MFAPGVTLAELEHDGRALEAAMSAWLTKIAVYDRNATFTVDEYPSTAVAIRTVLHMNPGVAKSHVALARKLASLPLLAEALGHGDISRAHAVVVANAYTEKRAEALAPFETTFNEAAAKLNPNDLAVVVQRVSDALDGDGGADNDDQQHSRRRLHLSKTFDRMGVLNGQFGPDDTDYLERALDTEMERDRTAGDTRTTTQRRADALFALLRRGVVRAELGTTRSVSRHFVVAVDVEDFYSPERIDELRLEVRRSGFLSAATLERICCDAQISRVIMAGKSEVLDVGRAFRTVTAAQWHALVIRDTHCQAPGCTRPPGDCEAHHLWHWAHGGPTNLDNLVLLCWKHHRERHKYDACHAHEHPRHYSQTVESFLQGAVGTRTRGSPKVPT